MAIQAWILKKGLGILSSRKAVQKVCAAALKSGDALTDTLGERFANMAPAGTPKDEALTAVGTMFNEGFDQSIKLVLEKLSKGEYELNGGDGDVSRKEAVLVACATLKRTGRAGLDKLNDEYDVPLLPESVEEIIEGWLAFVMDLLLGKAEAYAEAHF